MEAIKTTKTVKNGQILLSLPKQFWGQQVEIIILTGSKRTINKSRKASLRGCLQSHADPALISQEKIAWHKAVSEKYDNR